MNRITPRGGRFNRLGPMLAIIAGLLFFFAAAVTYINSGKIVYAYLGFGVFWLAFALFQVWLGVRR